MLLLYLTFKKFNFDKLSINEYQDHFKNIVPVGKNKKKKTVSIQQIRSIIAMSTSYCTNVFLTGNIIFEGDLDADLLCVTFKLLI